MRLSLRFVLLPAVASALLLACSSGTGAEGTSGTSSTASLSVGECEPVLVGNDDGVAQSDVAMTRSDSASTCEERGLTLGGSDGAYKCCKAAPIAVDAGPSTGACSVESLGRSDSCADYGTWKDDATKTCELTGGTLEGIHVTDACGEGLYRYAKLTCCSAAPIPDGGVDEDAPSPGDSDGGPAGDDGGIVSGDDDDGGPIDQDGGAFGEDAGEPCQYYAIASINGVCNSSSADMASAKLQCANLGLTLEDYSTLQGTCGKGKEAQANYACCGPTAITMTSGGPGNAPSTPAKVGSKAR